MKPTSPESNKSPRNPQAAIERNVSAVHDLRIQADDRRTKVQKLVDDVASFFGSTSSLAFHILVYGTLIAFAAASYFELISKSTVIDFGFIEGVATIEAIFLAVFVLINQSRMNTINRRHSDLALQIALLSEHELGTIAKSLGVIGEKLEIDPGVVRELRKLAKDVHPNEIVNTIKHQEAEKPTDLTNEANSATPP